MQSDFLLFIQIKLSCGVTSWCVFFVVVIVAIFFYVYGYLSKESLEFLEFVCLDKHQYMMFVFVLKFEFPKLLMNMCDHALFWKKREKHQKIFSTMVSCLKVMLNVLFA